MKHPKRKEKKVPWALFGNPKGKKFKVIPSTLTPKKK